MSIRIEHLGKITKYFIGIFLNEKEGNNRFTEGRRVINIFHTDIFVQIRSFNLFVSFNKSIPAWVSL